LRRIKKNLSQQNLLDTRDEPYKRKHVEFSEDLATSAKSDNLSSEEEGSTVLEADCEGESDAVT
jgi:hypothetical protein